jgi:hypothetical protein
VTAFARRQSPSLLSSAAAILTLAAFIQPAGTQNPEMQQKVQEIKQSQAANKQQLAKYTWQETQTISLKGEVKKVNTYLVSTGPNGQQQKTPIGAPAAQSGGDSSGRRGGRLKEHIVEKKKEEFEEYAQQIAALAKQYAQFDPDTLQQAFQKGNISFEPGGEGVVTMTIKSYLKPNDQVSLTFNRQQKGIQSFNVSSYLNDPSDAVKISAQFARIPNGPNHVSTMQIDGVSKQLTVNQQNSNYQLAS